VAIGEGGKPGKVIVFGSSMAVGGWGKVFGSWREVFRAGEK